MNKEHKFEVIRRIFEEQKPFFYSENALFSLETKGWRIVEIFKPIKELIIAYGHKNIKATHETTLEITKEKEISERADCIIAVNANKACNDLSEEFKIALKSGAKLKVTIEVNNLKDEFIAFGSPALKLTNDKSIVIRKSDYIDDRTLAILSSKSAKDINREIVEKLKNPNQKVYITLEILKET